MPGDSLQFPAASFKQLELFWLYIFHYDDYRSLSTITIINKSHYEINSIIRFLLPARRILRAQAAPSAAITDLTVTILLR